MQRYEIQYVVCKLAMKYVCYTLFEPLLRINYNFKGNYPRKSDKILHKMQSE